MNQAQMIALVNQLTAQLMSSGGGYGGDLHNIAGQMDNLLKSISEVGYQTPLTPSSGNFSPLVPQWLDPEIKIATVEMQDEIVLYNDLERKDVKNTIAEYNRLTSRGQGMHPFFAEGSAPGNTSTTWDKQYISVRYVGRRGEVSDVANTVALNGYANADALQVEKQERTNDLLLAVEAASFHGLNAINPLAFDGIIKQITAGGGLVTDKAGSSTSVSDIFDHIIELANNPNYKGGKPTVIYADLNAFGQFIKAAQETPNNLFFRDAIKSAANAAGAGCG
jgi:hypothetical protein